MPSPECVDEILFRGDWYHVLDVVRGRLDEITGDPADIRGINEYGDIECFGFERVEDVRHAQP